MNSIKNGMGCCIVYNTPIRNFRGYGLQSHNPHNGIGFWQEEQILFLDLLEKRYAERKTNNSFNYCEIGTHNGGSALLFLEWARSKPDMQCCMTLIDIKFPDLFFLNMKRAGVLFTKEHGFCDYSNLATQENKIWIECYEQPSEKVGISNIPSCEVLFIDGYHSYKQVWSELNTFSKVVSPNGYILSHDHSNRLNKKENRDIILKEEKENRAWLETAENQNFFVDEAFLRFMVENNYEYIDTLIDCFHPHETRLNNWVRGKTSPSSAIAAMRKSCVL